MRRMHATTEALPRKRLTRAESREVTRELLLQAAWDVYVERGYHDVSLEQVAERAGFTRRPIYSLFGSKERLYLEVMLVRPNALIPLFEEAAGRSRSLSEALGELGRAIERQRHEVDFVRRFELGYLVGATATRDSELTALLAEVQDAGLAYLADRLTAACLECEEQPPTDPLRLATLLYATVNGLLNIALIHPDDDLEELFVSALGRLL
jgi:AcrR family transcriptional regulator